MASSWECTGRLVISFQPFLGDALVPHAPGRTAREVERGIALLFADRRQDMDAAVFDLDRVSDLPLGIANLDLMQPADLFLIHLRMVCSPSPARRSTQWLKSSAAGARPNSPVSRTPQNRPWMSVFGRCPKNDGQVVIKLSGGGPSAGWASLDAAPSVRLSGTRLASTILSAGRQQCVTSSAVIDQSPNPKGDKRRLCFMTAARRRCPF